MLLWVLLMVSCASFSVRAFGGLGTYIARRQHIRSSLHASFSTSVLCRTELDIETLGRKLASVCDIGDTILMRGDLGAGKTTLARGFIRAKLEDEEMLITSPSYLLDNVYDYGPNQRIHHMDLYRLPPGCDMSMLGMPDIFTSCLCLVEWPQRMGDRNSNNYPKDFLDVNLNILGDESRKIELIASTLSSSWEAKLKEIV